MPSVSFTQALSAAIAKAKTAIPKFGSLTPILTAGAALKAASAASAAARASASGSEPKTGVQYYGPTPDQIREANLAARYTPKPTPIPKFGSLTPILTAGATLMAANKASAAAKASFSGSEPKTGAQYYGPGVSPLAHPTYRDTYTGPISENTWPYLVTPSSPTPTTVAPGVDYGGGGGWYDWGGYGGGGGGGGLNQWYVDMLKWNI